MQWCPRLKVYRDCNRKLTYNPETFEATSYNWWVFLKKIKGKWIFNDYSYSQTTNKHQHAMHYALKEFDIKIDFYVNQHDSLSHGIDIIQLYKQLFQLEIEHNRRGAKSRKEQIETIKKTIKFAQKTGKSMSKNDQKDLKNRLLKYEKERLENARKLRAEKRQKLKEENLKILDYKPLIGDNNRTPLNFDLNNETYNQKRI